MIEKDNILEISQVANGFIVRRAMSRWYEDNMEKRWDGNTNDYKVFRTMAELLQFVQHHFTHRDVVVKNDA